jgi:putative acetyltransferase
MSITIERAVEASPEVCDLIGELNDVLGAAYETHQRHGLSIVQLFEPNVHFFLARLDGLAVGCGGVAIFGHEGRSARMRQCERAISRRAAFSKRRFPYSTV